MVEDTSLEISILMNNIMKINFETPEPNSILLSEEHLLFIKKPTLDFFQTNQK